MRPDGTRGDRKRGKVVRVLRDYGFISCEEIPEKELYFKTAWFRGTDAFPARSSTRIPRVGASAKLHCAFRSPSGWRRRPPTGERPLAAEFECRSRSASLAANIVRISNAISGKRPLRGRASHGERLMRILIGAGAALLFASVAAAQPRPRHRPPRPGTA